MHAFFSHNSLVPLSLAWLIRIHTWCVRTRKGDSIMILQLVEGCTTRMGEKKPTKLNTFARTCQKYANVFVSSKSYSVCIFFSRLVVLLMSQCECRTEVDNVRVCRQSETNSKPRIMNIFGILLISNSFPYQYIYDDCCRGSRVY